MAGQGSINMPTQVRSPFEGILAALQAVHTYYGIDTEKQRQKLLELQARAEEPKAQEAEAKASELQNFLEGKGLGPLMGLERGYTASPSQIRSQSPPQTTPVNTPMAVNDATIASDAPPPSKLKSHIQTISEVTPSSNNNVATAGAMPKTEGGAINVTLPNGQTITMEPGVDLKEKLQKYQNDVLTGKEKQVQIQKINQEMGLSRDEARRKGTSELDGIKSKFDELSKEPKSMFTGAQQISKALLSGNPISEQMAQTELPMLQLQVKRLSDSVISEAESKDTISAIKNLISQKSTGHLTPKELSLINNAARLTEQNAGQELDKLASDTASSATNAGVPKNSDFIKNKILLPGGLKYQVPQTAVKVHPQLGASLFKQSLPGQWELIQRQDN